MTRLRRRVTWAFGLALILGGVLFAGPLFAWSPVTPGFGLLRSGPVKLHYRESEGVRPVHHDLQAISTHLEEALGLQFTAPVHVVLCDKWTDFRRFTPWLPLSRGLGAITLPIGLIVYVTPVVRNRDDVRAFIGHELAHVLLYQQTSISSRLEMERQRWLVEGISVRFGNPDSYMSPTEFRTSHSSVDLAAVLAPKAVVDHRIVDPRLSYSAYRFFLDSIIERHGADRFRRFLKAYVAAPEDYRQTFVTVFGEDFDAAVRLFAASAG